MIPAQPHRTARPEGRAEDVLDHVVSGADVVLGMADGEAVGAMDGLERHHGRLLDVRVCHMHALHPRPSIEGRCGGHLRRSADER